VDFGAAGIGRPLGDSLTALLGTRQMLLLCVTPGGGEQASTRPADCIGQDDWMSRCGCCYLPVHRAILLNCGNGIKSRSASKREENALCRRMVCGPGYAVIHLHRRRTWLLDMTTGTRFHVVASIKSLCDVHFLVSVEAEITRVSRFAAREELGFIAADAFMDAISSCEKLRGSSASRCGRRKTRVSESVIRALLFALTEVAIESRPISQDHSCTSADVDQFLAPPLYLYISYITHEHSDIEGRSRLT
jgi:hypothetical protein